MNQVPQIPDYESMLERFYRAFLGPGQVCVDVGAHEGRHLFPMLECVGHGGRVLAIEPIPRLADKLRHKVQDAGWAASVDVRSMALSDTIGTTSFMVAEDAPGYSGILKREYDVPTRVTEITVELSTLDAVAAHLDALHYLKIDAEGAEWSILRGAQDLLRRCLPVVSFEFGLASYGAYGVEPAEVHAGLAHMGYGIYDIRGHALSEADFVASSRQQSVWDYVAIPPNRDAESLVGPLRSED